MTRILLADGAIDLRLGDWRDVLADAGEFDVLITDAPYGPRTHAGYRSGGASAGSIGEQPGLIEYPPLTFADANELAVLMSRRVKKWAVIFGDHETWQWHAAAWDLAGWYVFAPIAWIRRDAPPRFSGDGPQRSAEWIMVARPRRTTRCGSLPGHYLVNRVEGDVNGSQIPGQKNFAGMCALVRHYCEPGDLVVDPFAGTGTTLLAAETCGCKAIGSEILPAHFDIAAKRLQAVYGKHRTPDMFIT